MVLPKLQRRKVRNKALQKDRLSAFLQQDIKDRGEHCEVSSSGFASVDESPSVRLSTGEPISRGPASASEDNTSVRGLPLAQFKAGELTKRLPKKTRSPCSNSGSASGVRSWADIEDESEEEMSWSQEVLGPWPQMSHEGTSGTDSNSAQEPCSSDGAHRGYQQQRPVGGGYNASPQTANAPALPKSQQRKMRNRALLKDQLAETRTMTVDSQLNLASQMLQMSAQRSPSLDSFNSLPSAMGDGSGHSVHSACETSSNHSVLSEALESTADNSADGGESGQPISKGSKQHDQGQCKPCIFVHSRLGCADGASCEFCHFMHKRKSKPNPCKDKRQRYRKLFEKMQERYGDEGKPNGGSEGQDGEGAESTSQPQQTAQTVQ